MVHLYIVCVIYNISISEIASLSNFTQFSSDKDDTRIVIIDNSDDNSKRIYNKHLADNDKRYVYISNGENLGISRSYNKAISLVDDSDSWIMFTDDDTNISLEYLNNVYNAIFNTEYEIISGIVQSNKGPMSPIYRVKLFSNNKNFIHSAGAYNNIYCINSCLCVKRSVFNQVRYNDDIFLDHADFLFMEDLAVNKLNSILIVDGEIIQNFSADTKTHISSAIKRYRLFKKDFIRYCKLTNKSCSFMIAVLIKHWLKLVLTSKYFK